VYGLEGVYIHKKMLNGKNNRYKYFDDLWKKY
jgi:hypothetical protein